MKRYVEYLKKVNQAVVKKTEVQPGASTQSTTTGQAPASGSTPEEVANMRALQKELREKKMELEKFRKEQAELLKKQEELLAFQSQVSKEKETAIIRAEVAKVAKKLNIKESALDDIFGLVSSKFKVQGDAVFSEEIKEEDGKQVAVPIDAETFMSSWIEGKDYYVQPPQAQPSGIPPVQSGPKPTVKAPTPNNKHGSPVFSKEDFFGRKV